MFHWAMKKKRELLFLLYMAVAVFGFLGAVMAETIPQCIILVIVSAFTCWCGFIILKKGTIDSDDCDIKDKHDKGV